jgi:arsenate reductase
MTGPEKKRVLFICVHNSARSQMAEALLQDLAGDRFEVMSAGLEPGSLNPLAVAALAELGIDISGNQTKSAFDLSGAGEPFDYVITVCDESQAEQCPFFPGPAKRFHWSLPDPSALTGTEAEKLQATIAIRDQIKARVEELIQVDQFIQGAG